MSTSFRTAIVIGAIALSGWARPAGAMWPLDRLARTPVQLGDGMRWFRRKIDGGLEREDDLRRMANRLRYARATK